MELRVQAESGGRFLEGAPGERLLHRTADVAAILEACLSEDAERVLLYSENLTERFLDLSSREAGEILQKLRNYQVRLAVVLAPEARLSSRFGELLVEENRGPYFRLFSERESAGRWLCER